MKIGSSVDRPNDKGAVTVEFGEKYAKSEQFDDLFREGMGLVEEAASYLDGEGRKDSQGLEPPVSLVYATESIRLTTRLMQLASWLLIRRAVNDGELTQEQALDEKHRVKLHSIGRASHTKGFEELPVRIQKLVEQSLRLYDRIIAIDKLICKPSTAEVPPGPNSFNRQLNKLQAAFEIEPLSEKRSSDIQ